MYSLFQLLYENEAKDNEPLLLEAEKGEDKRAGNVQQQQTNILDDEMVQGNYVDGNQINFVQ